MLISFTGFVGGLGISLLGAVLLFLGATGAFASESHFFSKVRYHETTGADNIVALFALGGIISLVGTGFLVGFSKQLKTMFKPVRVVATVLLFASIAMTFVSAFVLPAILCIVFVIVSFFFTLPLKGNWSEAD